MRERKRDFFVESKDSNFPLNAITNVSESILYLGILKRKSHDCRS